MAFAAFPATEMRATALLLNIVAAGYATWRLHRRGAIDRKVLWPLTVPSLLTAFVGGSLVLGGQLYFILTALLLIVAAALMLLKRTADTVEARRVRVFPAAVVGASAGFISGLTGVGGGVFLTPLLTEGDNGGRQSYDRLHSDRKEPSGPDCLDRPTRAGCLAQSRAW
jgi:hypothetical protein